MADEKVLLEISIALAETLRDKFPEITSLRPSQVGAILQYVLHKDVFAVLPTGMGKSLIFEVIPDICRRLSYRGLPYPSNPILIVICPLLSLVESYIKEFGSRQISCEHLSGENADKEGIKAGKYSVVFTSPEAIISNKEWRDMLRSTKYQESLFGIVTDEAHVVPKWGYSTKEKKAAFRECFGKLGELRSIVPQSTPILALTATASQQTKDVIIDSLALRPDMAQFYKSPNRPNIYLFKKQVTKSIKSTFQWLVQLIKDNGRETPKTIVYCKTQKDCGKLFKHFKCELGNHAYDSLEKTSKSMYLGMYHHNTLRKHQERVLNSLLAPNGVCRVVFASTALGMGVNIKDVRMVVHYGPPRQMEDFIQEIGRGGRDMLPAKAILLITGNHLQRCDETVKNYAKTSDTCLRKILLNDFDKMASDFISVDTHDCCIICHMKCKCDNVKCMLPLLDVSPCDEEINLSDRKKRTVSEEHKDLLKEILEEYKDLEAAQCESYFLPPESCTCFTSLHFSSVLKMCQYIFTVTDVLDLVPVYKKDHAVEILLMINDVFQDIQVDHTTVGASTKLTTLEHDWECGGMYESSEDSDASDGSNDSIMSGLSGLSWD